MSKIITSLKDNLNISDFSNFLRTPRTVETKIIDPTRMRVSAILNGDWIFSHSDIIIPEDRQEKILEKTDGQNNIALLYNKKGFSYPASVMGFDIKDEKIILNQIQGTKDKKVAFQVDSSFDVWAFYKNFLEENFLKRGISVLLNPNWRTHFMTSRSMENYNSIYNAIEAMKKKYNLS